MLIECTSCDAKYRVPDEKVAGKTVRLRCKRCGVVIVVASPAPAESSVMFSLAMLTQQAPKPVEAKPAEDVARWSAGDLFAPVLTAPVTNEPEVRRGPGRWIAVGAGIVLALAMPVAVYAMRGAPTAPAAITRAPASASTFASATPSATVEPPVTVASERLGSPPAPHPRNIAAPPSTASHVAKPLTPPPPKCCAGETDIECAMRRSVGKTCGS